MRELVRIDRICESLKQEWLKVPDMRFGQFMSNFLGWVYGETSRDVFFIEDNEMENLLKKYIDSMRRG